MSRRIIFSALVGFAAVAGAIAVGRVVFATSDDLPETAAGATADAVVVFAGGRGERLDRGRELVEAGVAPVLVLNTGTDRWNDDAYDAQTDLCPDVHPVGLGFEVVCIAANDTKGEAQAFAAVARERGWSSMVTVTADYHLGRASRWLERCWDGQVYRAAAPGPGRYVKAREMAAVTEMLTLDRSC